MLLKDTRVGDLRRSTLSWCRRTRISASNTARDRNQGTPEQPAEIGRQKQISTDSPALVSRFRFPVGTGGRIVRTIGIVRARAKIGLQNLSYNMRRLVTLERMARSMRAEPVRSTHGPSGQANPTRVGERL